MQSHLIMQLLRLLPLLFAGYLQAAENPAEGFYFDGVQRQPTAEVIFWQSVEKRPSEAGYQAYLEQYPEGIYTVLAKQRLSAYKAGRGRPASNAALPPISSQRQLYEPVMLPIPGGTFRMGDAQSSGHADEKPAHDVRIEAFLLSKYETTQAEWRAVMGDNPSRFQGGNLPVENVSWDDIQRFIRKLNAKTGKHYRLPSEAEWEYAARSNTATRYSWGNKASHEYANYGADECCSGHTEGEDLWQNTAPVGSFPANFFGLHDMHGNVWEWVQDCWHENYQDAPGDGRPWGEENAGDCKRRVVRGGSWYDDPWFLRSAYRDWYFAGLAFYYKGFRLAHSQ